MFQNESKTKRHGILTIAAGLAISQGSFALAPSHLATMCMISDTAKSLSVTKDLDLKHIADLTRRMQAEADQARARWVLTNIGSTDSHGAVTQKILETSAQNFIEDPLAQTDLGEALNTIQAPIESDIKFQSESGDESSFKISLNAVQAKAQLEYRGAIDASLEIHTHDASATLRMQHQLTETFQVALTSHSDSHHSSQTLGFSMTW